MEKIEETEKIGETETIETAPHSNYYYHASFIRQVLQGQEMDPNLYNFEELNEQVDNNIALSCSSARMVLKLFLLMLDFIDELQMYRDDSFDTIFEEFFDIVPEMTKFSVSDELLSQIEELSTRDDQQVRKEMAAFEVSDYKFHNYILDTLDANSSLGGVMQALASASGSFAAYYLKILNTYGKKKCKLMGKICLYDYEFSQHMEDLQDFNEWLSNYSPINFEDELSRKMGYYMDRLYQTGYLSPYRESVSVLFDNMTDYLYFEGYPYRYNYRGFLEPMISNGYEHDLFIWKKHELVEFSILRKRFHNLELDEFELGKLIIENRIHYSESNIKILIGCLKFYPKVKASLREVIAVNNERVSHYRPYIEQMHIDIPDKMTDKRASQVWHEFMEEKYIVRKSWRYAWTHSNNREFGYFVYYAHKFFYKQHAKVEKINWDAYCFLFSQDSKKKRCYESGCSEIARIEEKLIGKKKLPESAERIKKIFRRVRW